MAKRERVWMNGTMAWRMLVGAGLMGAAYLLWLGGTIWPYGWIGGGIFFLWGLTAIGDFAD